MSVPGINIVTTSGNLGSQSPAGRRPVVVMGPGTLGTKLVPTPLARPNLVKSTFGVGPGPECSCTLTNYGLSVVHVKLDASTAGDCDDIDVTGVTGTCVASLNGTPAPNDDYDVWVRVVTGGTIDQDPTPTESGVAYQLSPDGGNNWGPVTALGTANEIDAGAALGVGTLVFDLADGTLVAGDVIKVRCNGPECTGTDITAGLDVVELLATDWELLVVTTPVDATIQALLDAAMARLKAKGRMVYWLGSTRLPAATETDAQYQAALTTEISALVTDYGAVCSGSCANTSSMPGRAYTYRRRWADKYALMNARVDAQIDVAQVDAPGGAVPGVQIRDGNGNIIHHDENDQPGLDDLRLATLRTFPGRNGVYITNPRIRSAAGSDFEFVPSRRVMNNFERAQFVYLVGRLSKDVYVDPSTGYLLEEEAIEIEDGLNEACAAACAGQVSAINNVVSRTDNLLSNKTVTVDGSVIPKAYPKQFNVTNGFTNPALQVRTAG